MLCWHGASRRAGFWTPPPPPQIGHAMKAASVGRWSAGLSQACGSISCAFGAPHGQAARYANRQPRGLGSFLVTERCNGRTLPVTGTGAYIWPCELGAWSMQCHCQFGLSLLQERLVLSQKSRQVRQLYRTELHHNGAVSLPYLPASSRSAADVPCPTHEHVMMLSAADLNSEHSCCMIRIALTTKSRNGLHSLVLPSGTCVHPRISQAALVITMLTCSGEHPMQKISATHH
jgi:hypothetical protein